MRSRSDGPLGRRLIVGLVAVLGVLAATACNGPKKAATTVTTASGAGGTATTVTTAPGSGRPLDVEICEDRAVLPCDMQSVHVALPLAGTNVRLTWSNVRPGAGALGLGAWSLSPIVAFDPATGVFQDGGGRRRLVDAFRITLPSGDPGLAVASADSTVVFEFDSAGRHLASLDARTGAVLAATTWGPDGVEALSQLGAPGITVIRASGVVSEIRTTTGYATSLIIADGVPSAIVQPDGPDVRVTSDSTGRVTSVVRGVQRDAFEYDQAGRLTVAKHGNVRSSIERTAIANGFSVTTRSPLGRVTVDSVTGKGQTMRREHVDASGLRTTSERSPTTSIITYPDGTSTTTEFGPDLRFGWNSPLMQSSTLTLPDGATFSASETRTWTPDGLHVGEPVAMKWQRETAGIATTATYVPRSRTMTFTDADGRAVVTRFDDGGRPIASGYEGGPVTTRTLDETGRTLALTISTGGDGLTWTITGEAGLRSTTDPLGRTWQEGFDSAGRRRAVMDPAGTVFITGYDDTGRLAEVSLPNGTHRWTRGPDGQITTFGPPTSSTALSTSHTTYDADGALSTVTAGKTDVQQITRDGSGRVATQTIGRTLDYTYADDGSVRSVSDGDTTTTYQWNGPLLVGVDEDGRPAVSITYDSTGRVVGEQVGSDAPRILQYSDAGLLVTADAAHFTYDPALPLVTRLTVGDTTEARTYDAFGRLTAREVRSSNSVMFQERLDRNKLGMVAASDEQTNGTNLSSSYEYDPRDRLVGVKRGDSSEQFEYDANGNMLRRTIGGAVTPSTIGTDDALLHAGDAEYKYDPAGRLARRSDPAGATTYTYDSDSALAAVDLPDGRRVVYEVDALGRRTAKSVDGTTVDRWVYGVRTLGPIAHVDASGNVDATFTYEADSYTPVSMERNGVVYRLVTDVRGSVRQVVDTSTGAVVESIEYDPWGAVTADSAPGFEPFGFGGGLVDADTGLVRFGARDYDPNARRWTAPDPIGFASGSTNLYAFADDNPVTHRDPSGLRSVCVITFGCAGQFGTGGGFTVGGGLSDDGHGVGVADAGVTHGTPTVGCNIQFTCVGLGEGETLSDNESFDVSVGPVNFGVDQTPRGGEGVHGGVGISWPPFAISVPSDATARINAIISQRRGQILGFDARGGWTGWDVVEAHIPETEMADLIIELRSATAGVGTYSAKFDHLSELTGKMAEQVLASANMAAE